jgi:hypothetical protein
MEVVWPFRASDAKQFWGWIASSETDLERQARRVVFCGRHIGNAGSFVDIIALGLAQDFPAQTFA